MENCGHFCKLSTRTILHISCGKIQGALTYEPSFNSQEVGLVQMAQDPQNSPISPKFLRKHLWLLLSRSHSDFSYSAALSVHIGLFP